MDYGAFLTGMFGAGGIIGFLQFLINRHDNKTSRLKRIEKKIDDSKKESTKQFVEMNVKIDRNEQATTRLQLFFLLETQPDNEDAIEQTAYRYFIVQGGDAEAWQPFYRWAKAHNVDTDWYKTLLEREKGKQ